MSCIAVRGTDHSSSSFFVIVGGQQIGAGFNASKFCSEGYAETTGANRSILQAEPATHMFVLRKRRVQSGSTMSVQVGTLNSSTVARPNVAARHEKPTEGALAKQNIQDRYHGRSDPVAQKIMTKHAENQGLKPPEDTSIVGSQSLIYGRTNSCHLRRRCSCHCYPLMLPNSHYGP